MEKRARTDEPSDADVASRKTRAPYVSKACDTCRWRKSKCDGNQPCGHCDLYSKTCQYSTTRDNNASNANTARGPFQQRTDKDLSFSTIDQLGGLLTDLHTQLATLTARMDIAQCQDGWRAPLGGTHIVSSNLNSKIAVGPSPRLRFCGPTSPNFSLNMAQIKLTDYEDNSPNKRSRLPTMDEDVSDRDVDSISDSYTHHMHVNSSAISSDRTLAHLNAFATLDQALRLLETYQETIGNFHPILDFARLKQHAEKCFSKTTSGDIALDEDDFITLHLALSIALVAEGKSSIRLERSRLGCVFDMANSRITSPAAAVTQVTVALLMVSDKVGTTFDQRGLTYCRGFTPFSEMTYKSLGECAGSQEGWQWSWVYIATMRQEAHHPQKPSAGKSYPFSCPPYSFSTVSGAHPPDFQINLLKRASTKISLQPWVLTMSTGLCSADGSNSVHLTISMRWLHSV